MKMKTMTMRHELVFTLLVVSLVATLVVTMVVPSMAEMMVKTGHTPDSIAASPVEYTVVVNLEEALHQLDSVFLSTTTDISQLVDQTSCNLTSER